MEETFVILVDENDEVIGKMEKIEAHKKALLHRAISVFILNSKGEWLLQRRALEKYHSGGLWTNTSCTHPFPDESSVNAAKRRLKEEMGIQCELKEIFSFVYNERLDNNLTEYEFDHVFIGICDEIPVLNTNEVMDWKYISFLNLQKLILKKPAVFTVWFKKIYLEVDKIINEKGLL